MHYVQAAVQRPKLHAGISVHALMKRCMRRIPLGMQAWHGMACISNAAIPGLLSIAVLGMRVGMASTDSWHALHDATSVRACMMTIAPAGSAHNQGPQGLLAIRNQRSDAEWLKAMQTATV